MSMTIEYELHDDDWVALHELALAADADLTQPLSHVAWFGFLGSAIVDLVGLLFLYRVRFPFVLAFFTVYFILAYVLYDFVAKRRLRRAVAGHTSPLFARCRVALEDDGIRQQSDAYNSLISWKAVDGLGETCNHLVVHVGGRPTLVVPKRAFRDQQAITDFVVAAQRRRTGATAAAP